MTRLINKSTSVLLKEVWNNINKQRKRHLVLLLFFILIVSLIEMLSIGLVLPFLAILTNPDKFLSDERLEPFLIFLEVSNSIELIKLGTLVFIVSILVTAILRLLLLHFSTQLSFRIGSAFNYQIYNRALRQSYEAHLLRNTSEVIDLISNKTNIVIYGVLLSSINFISSAVMLILILIILVLIDPLSAFGTFITLGLFYYSILRFTKNSLFVKSEIVASQSSLIIKNLQEGLGSIRDVIITKSQDFYSKKFSYADNLLRQSQAFIAFFTTAPKYLLEMLGMLSIAILALVLTLKSGGVNNTIPTLGIIALSAQRLLPVLQQLYSSWANVNSSRSSLYDFLKSYEKNPQINSLQIFSREELPFFNKIEFDKLSFSYSSGPTILSNISFSIRKGDRVGIFGKTGSGKSTLVDILLGLLKPSKGSMLIDGMKISDQNCHLWQEKIAHVPQTIFLLDASIEENIAFGVEKSNIDISKVILSARNSQLEDFILSLPNQYKTIVGENGVQLSGGQRQRIAIARALYRHSEIVVLDEATSALDYDTENAVTEAIGTLSNDITIIVVAHRLRTLKNCNVLVEVKNSTIKIERRM